jgi:hypothetical protein
MYCEGGVLMTKPKLTRRQWLKTPYAGTSAQNTEADMRKLLEKYGIQNIQWTQGVRDSRPILSLRFVLDGRAYSVTLGALNAEADNNELLRQLKRAIYWTLKPLLEGAKMFFETEQLLLGFLEVDDGRTVWDVGRGKLPTNPTPGHIAQGRSSLTPTKSVGNVDKHG